MKNSTLLATTSFLTLILFAIHWMQDLQFGVDKIGPTSWGGIAILLVWLIGTFLWPERWWSSLIVLFGSILAVGVALLHLQGQTVQRVAASGDFPWFIFILVLLGAGGAFGLLLSGLRLKTLAAKGRE